MTTPPPLPGPAAAFGGTPLPAARPSPIDAARDALEHTRRRLFPFRFERWLALGLLAFLDQCGRQGGVNFPSGGGNSGGGASAPDLSQITEWISAHTGLLIALVAGGLVLVVALSALVAWLNARGIFMYLDAVVSGRADIGRPWREHAQRANSLFVWNFTLSMGLLGVLLALFGMVAAVVLGGSRDDLVARALWTVVLALAVFLPLALLVQLALLALRDFVAPLQLLGHETRAAVDLVWQLIKTHPGAFGLFVLLKIAFSLAAALVVLIGCCLTCCLALIPVISQAVFQPLWYFERAWSLFLLRQLGHDVFASLPQADGRMGAGL
jgi:hypothetical protein